MRLYKSNPAFEVELTIDNAERRIFAGYRPDIALPGEAGLYPVYPDFLDKTGRSIPEGTLVILPAKATMHPLGEDVRELLRGRIFEGQALSLNEGHIQVGTAVVTRLRDI